MGIVPYLIIRFVIRIAQRPVTLQLADFMGVEILWERVNNLLKINHKKIAPFGAI